MFSYENAGVGAKIKKIAKIYFWVITVVAIILALVIIFGGLSSYRYGYGGPSVIAGLIMGGIYVLVAYVSGIMLYGYGALIETNYENTQQQQEIIRQLAQIKETIPTSITIVKDHKEEE